MDDKFLVGIILGMLGGAVLVTNSVKATDIKNIVIIITYEG